MRTPISSIFTNMQSPNLLVLDTSVSPALPLPIKLGDANHDGFPDMLTIVTTGAGSNRPRAPYLVLSVPCAKGVAGCSSDGSGRRGWQVVKKDVDPLLSVQDARSVAFLDMDEDVGAEHVRVAR